jgi:hypothetical protein
MFLRSYNESGFAFIEDGERYIWIKPPYSGTDKIDYEVISKKLAMGSVTIGGFNYGPNKDFATMEELVEELKKLTADSRAHEEAILLEWQHKKMREEGVDTDDLEAVAHFEARLITRSAINFLTEEHFDSLLDKIQATPPAERNPYIFEVLDEYRKEAENKNKYELTERIDRYIVTLKHTPAQQ